MLRNTFVLPASIAVLLSGAQAATFYAIGPDPNTFVPDQLVAISVSPPSLSTIATLGDGSLGFSGGLTFGPGATLYAIANDSTGASSFYTVQPDATLSLVGAAGGLGFGFNGGLAYDPVNSTFYAAVNDVSGNSSLYSITGGGIAGATGWNLGTGFSGLAFDAADNLFYGIGNDSTGFSTLYDFSLGGPVTSVAGLGFGFGALTYDGAAHVLWAIDPVNNAGSQLFQISTAGTMSPSFTVGDGFAGLAAPQPAQTPEPAGGVGAGLLLIASALKRRKL